MRPVWKLRLSGTVSGAVNGLFGGGGGMVLVPLLSGQLGQRQLFPTCVGVMAPICCVSAAVYFFRADFSFLTALPYLIGGAAGGLLGGHFYRRVPTVWLKRAFALFLLYGGARYLL